MDWYFEDVIISITSSKYQLIFNVDRSIDGSNLLYFLTQSLKYFFRFLKRERYFYRLEIKEHRESLHHLPTS